MRFKQVDSAIVFDGFFKTCKRLFGDIPNITQMTQFIMIISCVKPRDEYPYDETLREKGKLIVETMRAYLVPKFHSLFQIDEF